MSFVQNPSQESMTSHRENKPLLGITIGDINGIGPEVILKALCSTAIRQKCRPIVFGPLEVLEQSQAFLKTPISLRRVRDITGQPDADPAIEVMVPEPKLPHTCEPGVISAVAGKMAGWAIGAAVHWASKGKIDAVVTAPISKHALNLAGYRFPGHTEFLQELTGTKDVLMMLLTGAFRVGLVTTHCAISAVPGLIKHDRILKKLQLFHADLRHRFNITEPRIAVAALNPHGGEAGMFGNEEPEEIVPAIEQATRDGIHAEGPFSADTLFARIRYQNYDGYLTMYHDQGLIPLKMQGFGKAVNYTAGLPIIRTSPDHGTAFDIAGKGVADPGSMTEAMKLAISLALQNKGS